MPMLTDVDTSVIIYKYIALERLAPISDGSTL